MLSSAPVLAFYDVMKPTIVSVDASSYDLEQTTLGCQRLLMRLMRFNVKAVHVPGKSLVVTDTLSCNPITGPVVSDTEEDVRAYVEAVIQTRPMSEPFVKCHIQRPYYEESNPLHKKRLATPCAVGAHSLPWGTSITVQFPPQVPTAQ